MYFMHYKSYTGIILKHQPHREADEVITFWSFEEGKARFLVRGVRKSASKLRGAVSPLSWLHLYVIPSEYLPVVYNVKVIKTYRFPRSDLRHLAMVFNFFEMVLRSTADRQPNHKISLLLRKVLDYLEQAREDMDLLIYFQLRLFESLGYSLQMQSCVSCQNPFDRRKSNFLSLHAGGLICFDCSRMIADVQNVENEVIECLLKYARNQPFSGAAVGDPSRPASTPKRDELRRQAEADPAKKKTNQILSDFFFLLTERRLNSQKFLQENFLAEA